MTSVLKSLITSLAIGAIFLGANTAAIAQYMGTDSHEAKVLQSRTASAPTRNSAQNDSAPLLQGVNTIPETNDATVINGINNVGTVRVNMLANLEALLNICANGAQLTGILWGACLLWACIRKMRQPGIARALAFAMLPIILGVCTPASLNWVIAAARDANLFS